MNIPTTVCFSFLTTGPWMTLSVPKRFDSTPKLTSPMLIHETSGARSFYFTPAWLDAEMTYPVVSDVAAVGGRTVTVFERPGTPAQWWLRWQLAQGSLYSFLEEEDGPQAASTVARSLFISEDLGKTPVLLPELPLVRAVAPRIGYGEFASFVSTDRSEVVRIRRPGFLPEGKLMSKTDEKGTHFRVGAPLGCEINLFAPSEEAADATAQFVAASLSEAAAGSITPAG